MSKPNSSLQEPDRQIASSSKSSVEVSSQGRQSVLPETAQELQKEVVSVTGKLAPSSPTELYYREQPPVNFELAGYAALAADFIRGLHLRGKLLPLLREATVENLLLQSANTFELEITPDELETAANLFRQRNGLLSKSDMENWLEREHLTLSEMEDALHRDLLMSKLRNHVTQGRIASQFDAAPRRYDRVHLRQLVVKREDLARTLRDQLNQSGSNFAEIARDYSTNQTLKDQDGDLKLVFRYQIPQDVSEAIFSVQASEIVGPIAMTSGFHLFQIESIEAAELDDITAENIRSELFNDWLSQHLHDIKIDSQLLKLIPSY